MLIEELENLIDKIIAQYSNPKKLKHPFGVPMAEVMKVARKRIDGKLVKDIINEKLGKFRVLLTLSPAPIFNFIMIIHV